MTPSPTTDRHKQARVIESLEQLARNLGVGARFPRVRDMAASLGVTVATLDQALRHLADRGLIKRIPRSGIFVAPAISQKSIGLVFGRNIFSDGISPIYRQLIEHCRARATSHNERFSFYLDIDGMGSGSAIHRDLESAVEGNKLDGVILACRGVLAQEVWIRSKNIPLVVMGETDLGPGFVIYNRESLVRLALESLGDCRSVGIIGVWHRDVDVFQALIGGTGTESRPDWMIRPQHPDGSSAEGHEAYGYASMRALLSKGTPLPEGLIVTDDTATRGVCIALGEAGLEVGRDIRIASHANKDSSFLSEWSAALRLVEIDPVEMVEAVFEVLEDLMSGNSTAKAFRLIEPKLKNI